MVTARRTFLLVGIAFTAWLVSSMNGSELMTNFRSIGWGFTIILGQEILAFGTNTLGWWLVFPSRQRPALDLRLLRIRLESDAVNYATPTAGLAGEVVRVDLLKHEIGAAAATASVAVAKLAQSLGQALYITAGLLLGTWIMPALRGSLGSALRFAVLVLWAVIGGFLLAQRKVSLEFLLRRYGSAPNSVDFARDVDSSLREVHAHGSALAASVVCFAFGWMTGALEVWTVLVCLGLEQSVASALAIDALIVLIDAALFFMPSKLVALEGGAVAVFEWAGLGGAAGLAFGLARRVRQVVWAAVGLIFFAFEGSSRPGPAPAHELPRPEGSSIGQASPAPGDRLRDAAPPVMEARRTTGSAE